MTIADMTDELIPEGWALTTIGTAFELNPRKVSADTLPSDAAVTFVPMPAVDAERGAITCPELREFGEVRNGYTSFAENDVIVAKITPCMENGKAAIARNLANGLAFGSTEFHVLRPTGAALPEYVYYFVRQARFRREAESHMTGSVGQKRVPPSFLGESVLPLAPPAEQQRIVAKIEALLERVNKARERLDRVPDILKKFRQSVLAAACSGRLTADWREDSGDSDELPSTWETVDAGSLYIDARYGTSKKCSVKPVGIPVLRVPNIARGVMDLTSLKYTELPAREREKLEVQSGDVIVCRTNGSLDLVGKAAVIPELPEPYAFASYLIRLRLDAATVVPSYFHTFLSGGLGRGQIEKRARSTAGQFNLNLEILRELELPLPPLDEQEEIVRRVAMILAKIDAVKSFVASGATYSEVVGQSVLAKAFAGELVETEADLARRESRDYESALVLLERITAERGASQNGKPLRTSMARDKPASKTRKVVR